MCKISQYFFAKSLLPPIYNLLHSHEPGPESTSPFPSKSFTLEQHTKHSLNSTLCFPFLFLFLNFLAQVRSTRTHPSLYGLSHLTGLCQEPSKLWF